MTHRSWLLVPADSQKKLALAAASEANAIVVDLAESVLPERKVTARVQAGEWLALQRDQGLSDNGPSRWVRINSFDSPHWRHDLVAVMPGVPQGIVLSGAAGPLAVQQLAAELYELEQQHQLATGSTRIIAVVGETAHAAATIASYVDASLPRLAGLTWDPRRLAAAIGARRLRDDHGRWTDALRAVRGQILLTASARGIAAVDAPYLEPDKRGLVAAARAAADDGFAGMLAVHPAQIAPIAAAYAQPESLVGASTEPGRGMRGPEGGMIDAARLQQSRPPLVEV
jgi:citrate lyase subunit beta/citryl-CoA lyase